MSVMTAPNQTIGSPTIEAQRIYAPTLEAVDVSSPYYPKSSITSNGLWLNVVSHLLPKYGGISSAVPELASAVASAGAHPVSVTGFCHPGEFKIPHSNLAVQFSEAPFSRLAWYRHSAARRAFRGRVTASAGLHIHGVWDQSTAAAADTALKLGRPYIISAHGMLERWALKNKRLKKKIYLELVERSNLENAACLHALTEAEVHDYRRLGLRNPIAVIPNGVHVPQDASPEPFLSKFPQLAGKPIVLFLGRIHFKKGLDILCQAWARLGTRWPDAQLVFAGPDFEGTRPKIEELVARLGITSRVTFTGMMSGEMKWSAFAAANCFVLPSYSEGLSVSVLEAMGMGLPVIVTEQCNLPEVSQFGCGWVIQPKTDEVEQALWSVANAGPSMLAEMGTHGRQLVASCYSWRAIGEQMSSLYSWVETGCKPHRNLPAKVRLQFFGEESA